MKDDQKKIWEAHELADGHWVGIDGKRHLWPLYSDQTACGLPVVSGTTPPGTANLPVCGECSEAVGSDLNKAEHITIVGKEPDQ